ncbi:DUF4215 domain-containing protein [Candidatus Woesearchaeota archaeon]|nr:DUF4215 domain-containing protein [Candidatus Woesearchaeota archaeon]
MVLFTVLLSLSVSAFSYKDLFTGLFGMTGMQVVNTTTNVSVSSPNATTYVSTSPATTVTASLTNPRAYWVLPGTFDQSKCGNGQQDPGEECDDGNNNNNDGCDANCKLECGNGVITPGEQCGEPGLICPPMMDCNAYNCQCYPRVPEVKQRCCDGILTPPEECEHSAGGFAGPPMSVPPCAPFFTMQGGLYNKVFCINCICQNKLPPPPSTYSHCGNGLVETGLGEQCDDGNQKSGDGCSYPMCWYEWCGDMAIQPIQVWSVLGYFPLMTEQCDPPDGNLTCDDYCQVIGPNGGSGQCGDGVVQAPNFVGFMEECDPPNNVTCNNTCQNVTAAANVTFCGDGTVQSPNSFGGNEQCEPPNTATCDANCQNVSLPVPPPVPPGPPTPGPSGTGICGDMLIQLPNSQGIYEQCEPPNTTVCNATCQLLLPGPPGTPPLPPPPGGGVPSHCTNTVWDGDESDLNCGGSCPACTPPLSCWTNSDCTTNNCDFTNAMTPLPLNPLTGQPYTIAEIQLLAGQSWIIPYQGVCVVGVTPLPGAPPPLPIPRIDINFNNGQDFYIDDTIFCSANLFDLEGDTITYVNAVIRDFGFFYNYGSDNLMTNDCTVHTPYNVTCTYSVANILGLKGSWDCDYFYVDDANSVNISVSDTVDMLNTPPQIFPSANSISVPVGTLINITNVGVDPNLEDNLTFSVNAAVAMGTIDSSTGDYLWQTAAGDEGNYTVDFIVDDGEDTDSALVYIEVTPVGAGGVGTCGDGTVQAPNSNGINEQCEPPGTATCDASCQTITSGQQPPTGGGGSSGGGGGGHSARRANLYRSYYGTNLTAETGPCEPMWECKDWGVCKADGSQSRYCVNNAPCQRLKANPEVGRLKIESRSCEHMTCFDGVMNQGEEGIDCGGPCPQCPTCYDGFLNQGEEGIDCGGPCEPCALPEELFPAEVKRERLGWLSLLLLLIVIGAIAGVGLYTYLHHRNISFVRKPTILGPGPGKPVTLKVAPKPKAPIMPAAPMPTSNVKKEINKLISQTYFELDNNNMRRVRELTEKINQLYKQLPAGEKKDVYNNYMTLFKDIKKKL